MLASFWLCWLVAFGQFQVKASAARLEVEQPSRISQMSAEQLRKDWAFLMQIQKELLLVTTWKQRQPEMFCTKFRPFDNVRDANIRDAVAMGSISAGLALGGLADLAGDPAVAQDINLASQVLTVEDYVAIEQQIATLFTAKITRMIQNGRSSPSEFSPDVTLGHLYRAYQSARNVVGNAFFARSQDWFKYTGTRAVPIFQSLKNLRVQVGSITPQEEFILDEQTTHIVPSSITWAKDLESHLSSLFRINQDDVPRFNATPSLKWWNGTDFDFQPSESQNLGLYGRLGDGRGWIRVDGDMTRGKLLRLSGNHEEICARMREKLDSVQLAGTREMEHFRIAVSKLHGAVDSVPSNVGNAFAGVAALVLGLAVPSAAPVLAIVMPAIGLARTGVRTAATVGFETSLEPLLHYVMISLASFEFALFEPTIKAAQACTVDDLKEELQKFGDNVGPFNRTPCDIVDNPCASGQICIRRGLFAQTSGQFRRRGFCIAAAWKINDNGLVCAQHEDCRSGLCHYGAQLPDDNLAAFANKGILEFVSPTSIKDIDPEVKRMLGVCVKPCDPASAECSKLDRHAFGFVPASA